MTEEICPVPIPPPSKTRQAKPQTTSVRGLSSHARKALAVHVGEKAGAEIADLIQQMAAEIEELRRGKVSITPIVPGAEPIVAAGQPHVASDPALGGASVGFASAQVGLGDGPVGLGDGSLAPKHSLLPNHPFAPDDEPC